MTENTQKLIADTFEGIKEKDLSVWGATAETITFSCSVSNRLFLVEDDNNISEITPFVTKHYKDA